MKTDIGPATNRPDTNPGDPPLTDHAYDGIHEYDNPMPGWWKWIFVLTVVFSFGYWLVATLAGDQMSPAGTYDRAAAEELKRQLGAGALKPDEESLMRLLRDAESRKSGQAVFMNLCAPCHNRDGSGLIGPNMTDEYYTYVKKIEDIPRIVNNGTGNPNSAMPPWAGRISPNDAILVSAYMASLRGQNLDGKRADGSPIPHEGVIIPPWGAK
jgi:cytochrome c oxidase cbb3-type subunit 3